MNEKILQVKGLTKIFPGNIALNQFDFDLHRGEVHALIGENGAGKSTFCRLLTGVLKPDGGSIELFGKAVEFKHTSEALKHGISMVYQERNLIGHLTAEENVCLGSEPTKGFFIDQKKIHEIASTIRDSLGIEIDLSHEVNSLGAGTQQIIEIIRALYHEPQILILDEPTASLGKAEITPFLDFMKKLAKEKGIAIIFISHKLDEVYAVSDRISVLVEGSGALTDFAENLDREKCITAMLKKDKIPNFELEASEVDADDIVLRVGDCHYDEKHHHLGFHVCRGETIGFYGLVGSGRTECAQAIFGLRPMKEHNVVLNGEKLESITPFKMIEKGLILTPESRAHGMFSEMSLTENTSILFLKQLSSKVLNFVNVKKMNSFTAQVLQKNIVKYKSQNQLIRELSGGNIQKIIIGRSYEIDQMSVLILDEPTNGLDLGAKNEVYHIIGRLVREEKKSVIFISSEIEELVKVCDRIYIFLEGNVVAEFSREEFENKRILDSAFSKQRA